MSLIQHSKQSIFIVGWNRFSHSSDNGFMLTVSTEVDEEFIAARYGLYANHRLHGFFNNIDSVRLTFHESIVKMLISKVKDRIKEICQKLMRR